MRWRGKNCSKIGQVSVRQSLSELCRCVILKGMRGLLSTYQNESLFLGMSDSKLLFHLFKRYWPLRNLAQARYAPAYQVLVRLIPPTRSCGSCSRVTPDAELPFLHVYPPDGNTPLWKVRASGPLKIASNCWGSFFWSMHFFSLYSKMCLKS